MTRIIPVRVQKCGEIQNTSLEPDPRRVLNSLGQDSSPAARAAITYTWARQRWGARPRRYTGGVYGWRRIPSEVQLGKVAAESCTAAAAKKAGCQSLQHDPFVPHTRQHCRVAGRRTQEAAHARASMLLCALDLVLCSNTLRTSSKSTPVRLTLF